MVWALGIKTEMGLRGDSGSHTLDKASPGWLWTSEVLVGIAAEKAPIPLTSLSQLQTHFCLSLPILFFFWSLHSPSTMLSANTHPLGELAPLFSSPVTVF